MLNGAINLKTDEPVDTHAHTYRRRETRALCTHSMLWLSTMRRITTTWSARMMLLTLSTRQANKPSPVLQTVFGLPCLQGSTWCDLVLQGLNTHVKVSTGREATCSFPREGGSFQPPSRQTKQAPVSSRQAKSQRGSDRNLSIRTGHFIEKLHGRLNRPFRKVLKATNCRPRSLDVRRQ